MATGNDEFAPSSVLFDIDGTLVDSLAVITAGLGDTFERFCGVRPKDGALAAMIGLPLPVQFAMFREAPPAASELQSMIEFAIDRFESLSHLERPFDDAISAFEHIARSGTPVALVSSKSRRELDSFISRNSWTAWAAAAISSSDVPFPKPNPECVLLACERLGTNPRHSCLIGDSVFDIRCAKAAGAIAIAVAYGAGNCSALESEHPHLLLNTPTDVLHWATKRFSESACVTKSSKFQTSTAKPSSTRFKTIQHGSEA